MIANTAAYHFAVIDAPQALCDQLLARAEAAQLRGTILVAGEGLNLFLAGAPEAVEGFYAALRSDVRFADMRVKTSFSEHQPFARLKAKVKDEIISFRRDDGQPLDYPRAPAIDPATVQRWLRQGHDDAGKPVVMLDTRNLQEVEYGTFKDALVLPIHKFTDLPEALAPHREALKDSTVVSFCTGGIRCEKAALWMLNDGMDNVLQLDGGILGYFEEVGGEGYEGRCFVFDERVALDAELIGALANDAGRLSSRTRALDQALHELGLKRASQERDWLARCRGALRLLRWQGICFALQVFLALFGVLLLPWLPPAA